MEAQQRMVEWCKRLLVRVDVREAIDLEIVMRDLERDFRSLGIDGGTLRDLCIAVVTELEHTKRRETDGKQTRTATD